MNGASADKVEMLKAYALMLLVSAIVAAAHLVSQRKRQPNTEQS